MSNLIGQSLGRYHILEQLGEGGMAVVYKAYDTRLERNVAIKVILPGKEHTEKFLKRFEREAKVLAQLNHPNIVKIIDYGEYEGLPYLVMEYIPGGTLKNKLTGRPIPWQAAARLLFPIARALAYAHENKIIHRDIKPSNILITQSGESMLSDFGIAKMLEAEETLDLTGTGVGVGTPEYMSPEQAQGKVVDFRSDIYSLGVVLYEMIAGRKPYLADTPYAVAIKQVNEPLPRPKQFIKDMPDTVEQILLKALAKKPEARYQNMGECAAVLEKIAAGNQIASPWPRIRLSRAFIISSVSAVLLIGAVFIALGRLNARPVKAALGRTPIPIHSPQPQLAVVPTATIVLNGQNSYYDEFQDPQFDGGFNQSLWSITDGSSSTKITQRAGVLILADSSPSSGQGQILELNKWKASTFGFFEVKMRIDNVVGENGNVTINTISSSIPQGWMEFGLTAYSNSAKAYVAGQKGNIAERPIQYNTWYTLRVVFNHETNTLTFFIDGDQFSNYLIPSKVTRLKPNIQLWHPSGSYFSGAVDEVRIGN